MFTARRTDSVRGSSRVGETRTSPGKAERGRGDKENTHSPRFRVW